MKKSVAHVVLSNVQLGDVDAEPVAAVAAVGCTEHLSHAHPQYMYNIIHIIYQT